jgi:RNA polymerase sigma factor (TIGR02999 family)
MTKADASQVTAILEDVRRGKPEVIDQLIAVVYPELRGIAGRYLRSERPHHTQPTALVHETYARLFGSKRIDWKNRAHFFAAVATEMRRILVDYARARNAQKGPGKRVMISLASVKDAGAGHFDRNAQARLAVRESVAVQRAHLLRSGAIPARPVDIVACHLPVYAARAHCPAEL